MEYAQKSGAFLQQEAEPSPPSGVLSPEAFRAVFQNAAIGIALVAADGEVLGVNPALQEMLGYSQEELVRLGVDGVTHPDDVSKDAIFFQRLIRSECRSYTIEKRYRRKDGSIMWGRLSLSLVPSGKAEKPVAIGILEDITDRKAVRDELKSRQDRLSLALDVAEATAWEWNVSSSALTAYGELPAFGGQPPRNSTEWHNRIYPEDWQKMFPVIQDRMRNGGEYEFDYRIHGTDDKLHWLHSKARVYVDESGQSRVLGVTSEVTRRKMAEQKLQQALDEVRRTSERLQLALTTANAATWDWDAATDELLWDQGGAELYGRPLSTLSPPSEWRKAVHPDDLERVKAVIADALATRSEFETEYRVIWPDGSEHWLVIRGRVLCDSEGTPLRMTGINMDVTERKKSEENLRAIQERFRRAQAAAKVGAYDWDLRANDVHWSAEVPTLENLASRGTFQELMQHVHVDDRSRLLATVERMLKHESEQTDEVRINSLDDEVRWVQVTGKALRDSRGIPIHAVGVAMDITERKRAEEGLRRRENELRLVIDALPSLVAYVDRDQRYRFANRTYRLWMGEDLQVEGRGLIEVLGPEAYEVLRPHREEALRGHISEYEGLVPFRHGGDRFVHSLCIPDLGEEGEVRGYVTFITDLTERKKAEQSLRNAEKLAATGRLAATIAHEINNPLEAIMNLLFLARNDSSLSKTAQDYLVQAEQELARAAQITRQTLGFYRDGTAPEKLKVRETIDDVLRLYMRKLSSKRIRVEKRYQDEGEVTAFAGEIRQLFSNLIANAVDAMNEAGTLTVKISRWSSRSGAGIRTTIADTGSGIEREKMKKVFEPFFTTKKEVGTGLGLWLCKNIAEKHGGKIWLKSSRQGQRMGTALSVFLPVTPPAAVLSRLSS
ncbi:MAG TPA: PAS domain S-box protein [Terriglobales bacterium]|nr:PAS domain S-box protein [Terriglobales bacterium]